MSRKFVPKRRPTNRESKVTLFPFLAVLLCTMGALIMLLVVIARNVREQSITVSDGEMVAATVAEQKITNELVTEISEQIKMGTEEAEWFTENLNQSKKEAEETLAEKQIQLALAEKETQKVHGEIERLAKLAEQLERNEKTNTNDVAKLKLLLEQRKRLQQKEELELAEIQKDSANSAKSYAIIPYRGTAGTYRRPIYIECRNDKVIIQPEGVELTETDFLFTNRPDNPLDTVLRVIRQYYLETTQIVRGTEPYPLLIVRPSGVEAYEATRRAIGTWIQEFGYELVEEDSIVEYPKPSEELKTRIEKQLEISRHRLAGYLNAVQTEQMASTRAQQYRLDHRGNVLPSNEITPALRNRRNGGNNNRVAEQNTRTGRNGYAEIPQSPSGNTNNNSNNNYNNNNNNYGSSNNNSNNHSQESSPNPDISLIERRTNTGNIPISGESDSSEKNKIPQQNPSFGTQTIVAGTPASVNPSYGSAYFSQQQQQQQQQQTQTHSELPATGSYSAVTKSTPTNPAASEYSKSSENLKQFGELKWQSPQLSGTTISETPITGTPITGQGMNGMGIPVSGHGISSNRMENWALRDVTPFATAVSRNIKIQCEANQYVLLPQTGLLGMRVIPITNSVYEATDKLVTVIWEFMDSWGIAGEKMYWRPVLQVKVLSGGEQRFQELKSLLQNSGIVIVNSE
ncbi:MAG: hypothetical protein LBE12_10150 [Planctomycetaceae bacterium]|jgi:hypothetical protein|nr:hypothetical protein [Planctomycetaceae bacterium]